MDRFTRLKEDLWARWRQQGERLPVVLASPTHADTILYARRRVFDLKTYDPRKFPAGGRTSAQPFPGVDNHVYHIDSL